MKTRKEFLDFVQKNHPPMLPGDSIYSIALDGSITKRKTVKNIVLDENWNWKMTDENGSTIEIEPSDILSLEEALERRNKIKKVKYLILQPEENGEFFIDSNFRDEYSIEGCYTLDVSNISDTDNYVTEIIKKHRDCVNNGTVINIQMIQKRITVFSFIVSDKYECQYNYCRLNHAHNDLLYKCIQEAFD